MTRLSAIGSRLRSPLGIAAVMVVVAAVVAAVVIGAKMVMPKHTRAMCAEFTDAVGLYPGNKVALLGIEVGSTTAIVNKPDHVEVDFTVPTDLDLPADIGAVTYSQSIVTDRHIELTKPYTGGPKFTGPGCIKLKSTKTPISVSETFTAIGKLADAVLDTQHGQDPSQAPGVQAINDSLRAFSRSMDGTGPGLNQTLRNLVTMLADPYKADADYRQLFENSEILTSDFLKNWDSFATVIRTLPTSTQLVEGLSDNFGGALIRISPPAADLGRHDEPVGAADLSHRRQVDPLAGGLSEQAHAGHPRHDQLVAAVQPLDERYLRAGVGNPQRHLYSTAGFDFTVAGRRHV